MLMNGLKVYHTVKHLKLRQILGQIAVRVRKRISRPETIMGLEVPLFVGLKWEQGLQFLPPGTQENQQVDILKGKMTFLNSTQEIGWVPDWECADLPKLWCYNLHYFEWLWSLDYEHARKVVVDWVEKVPAKKGQVGWEPYPISLRLMNWCGVFCAKHRGRFEEDEMFQAVLWESVYRQVEFLGAHLETHLLANHFLENGAALAFVGSCFEGGEARSWLNQGLAILKSELPEQVLLCGMHFELSPMYHCRILYLMILLDSTGNERISGILGQSCQALARALSHLCHPDSQISLFNDSAFRVYNHPRDLIERVEGAAKTDSNKERGGVGEMYGPFELEDAGYYGWRDTDGNYLICDFGKVGPDYQPGHAHADIGSYELSLRGTRVIVDSGIHDYEDSEFRSYARSSAAHNTVEIEGRDQCELWGTFRMARRGYPQDVKFQTDENGFTLSGSHTGYRRLKGRPNHARQIRWDERERVLSVQDRVTSGEAVSAISRIHLHPDCSIQEQEENRLVVRYPQGMFQIDIYGAKSVLVEKGWYFPEFGKKFENLVIEICAEGERVEFGYEVRSLDSANH